MRITAPSSADVSDRAARVLGEVAPRAASVWDTSDRAARDLGKVDIAAFDVPLDVSDRLARLLGEAQVRLASAYANDGADGSSVSNPVGTVILATTGDLATAGLYEIDWVMTGQGADELGLRWRDSLNAVKESFRSGAAVQLAYGRIFVRIVANDDVVIVGVAGTGVFSGWLSWRMLV